MRGAFVCLALAVILYALNGYQEELAQTVSKVHCVIKLYFTTLYLYIYYCTYNQIYAHNFELNFILLQLFKKWVLFKFPDELEGEEDHTTHIGLSTWILSVKDVDPDLIERRVTVRWLREQFVVGGKLTKIDLNDSNSHVYKAIVLYSNDGGSHGSSSKMFHYYLYYFFRF
jgi:hypothetical protein